MELGTKTGTSQIQAANDLLPFEPLPAFSKGTLLDDSAFAGNRGKRIGILIVTFNAVTTLTKVLKRITPNVWKNVEEIAIFDDASQDATYELAMGLKAYRQLEKLQVLSHSTNLGYGGNQKAGYRYFAEKGFDIVVLLHGDGQYAPEILIAPLPSHRQRGSGRRVRFPHAEGFRRPAQGRHAAVQVCGEPDPDGFRESGART